MKIVVYKENLSPFLDVNFKNVKMCKSDENTDLYTVYICLYTVHFIVLYRGSLLARAVASSLSVCDKVHVGLFY